VVVENRTGASGVIAMQVALASQGGGTTLVLSPEVLLTLYPHTQKSLPYDPFKDFVQIGPMVSGPHGLATASMTSAQTLAEFLAWCKANPGKASFGTPGEGTPQHFVGAMFARAAGIDLLHVPYKGGVLALQDLQGGQISALISALPLIVSPHRNGSIKVLAVTGRERADTLPNVPTLKEAGFDGFLDEGVIGLIAPARTPAHEVRMLSDVVQKFVRSKEFAQAVSKLGQRAYARTLDEYAKELRQASEYWAVAVRTAGFKPQ